MNDSERMLIDYLKSSIDNLAAKFDKFLESQEKSNEEVRATKALAESHETRLIALETPAEKWLLANHPMLYDWLRVVGIAVGTVILFHFFPKAANWLGALIA